MTWTVVYTHSARDAIRKLDPAVRERVRRAVLELASDPTLGKPLHFELKGLRSWRTGDWRIVYQVQGEKVTVVVVTVGHRRDVYARVARLLGR